MDRIYFPSSHPQVADQSKIQKGTQKDSTKPEFDPQAFSKAIERYHSVLPELEGAIDRSRSDLANHARMKLQDSHFLIKHMLGLKNPLK